MFLASPLNDLVIAYSQNANLFDVFIEPPKFRCKAPPDRDIDLVAWLREFRRTLEIIARTLREVVNRVRLCGHHTRRCLRGEVHVYGVVMQRWGEGGDQFRLCF